MQAMSRKQNGGLSQGFSRRLVLPPNFRPWPRSIKPRQDKLLLPFLAQATGLILNSLSFSCKMYSLDHQGKETNCTWKDFGN